MGPPSSASLRTRWRPSHAAASRSSGHATSSRPDGGYDRRGARHDRLTSSLLSALRSGRRAPPMLGDERDHASDEHAETGADRTRASRVSLGRPRQVRRLHRPKLDARSPFAVFADEIRFDKRAHRLLGHFLCRPRGGC